MRLVRFDLNGVASVGVLVGEMVANFGCESAGRGYRWVESFEAVLRDSVLLERAAAIHAGDSPLTGSTLLSFAKLRLLAVAEHASKVIGVGMNYGTFVSQLGAQTPLNPVLFHKTSAALSAAGQMIIVPPETREAVPEGELAVIIGRRAHRVAPGDALAYVAGYACANDISARNLEFQTSQWTSGKMLATFCPLGPMLVTVDEIGDAAGLGIRTFLNGDLVQAGNTDDMIFNVPELVSRISHLVMLEVGDVILTGTPSDLGLTNPPVFLRDGDTVRVDIDQIGSLENPIECL